MQEIFDLLGNQAFPIVVSIYLLTRFEGKIEALRLSIEALNRSLLLYGKELDDRRHEDAPVPPGQ